MNIFEASHYRNYIKMEITDLELNDFNNRKILLIQVCRGGYTIYKIMELDQVYRHYGYNWIKQAVKDNWIILKERA